MAFSGPRTDAQRAEQSRRGHMVRVGKGYVHYPERAKPYVAFIKRLGRKVNLGCFQSPGEARAAYLQAKALT